MADRVEDLIVMYERAIQLVLAQINRAMLPRARPLSILRQIDEILRELGVETEGVIELLSGEAYADGSSEAIDGIVREAGLDRDELDVSFGLVDRQAVAAIAVRSARDLQRGIFDARRTMAGLVMDTQLGPDLNLEVRREVGANIAAGGSRRELSSRLIPLLRDGSFSAEGFEALTDTLSGLQIQVGKAKMPLKSYAALVARTMQRDAATAGSVNRMKANGLDLMEVTVTGGADDSCFVYEGLIVSISGNDKRFPPMNGLPHGRPPFHPNCTHVLAPRIEETLTAKEKKGMKVNRAFLFKTWGELERLRRKGFGGSASAMRARARAG